MKKDIEKPVTWKELGKLHKEKKVHTQAKRIRKYGVLLMIDDLEDFDKEQRKEMRKNLKEMFDEFLEEHFKEKLK